MVDLINFRGITWNEEDMGMTFQEIEIPADIVDEARELRGNCWRLLLNSMTLNGEVL